jgi:hypothetical protein
MVRSSELLLLRVSPTLYDRLVERSGPRSVSELAIDLLEEACTPAPAPRQRRRQRPTLRVIAGGEQAS